MYTVFVQKRRLQSSGINKVILAKLAGCLLTACVHISAGIFEPCEASTYEMLLHVVIMANVKLAADRQ